MGSLLLGLSFLRAIPITGIQNKIRILQLNIFGLSCSTFTSSFCARPFSSPRFLFITFVDAARDLPAHPLPTLRLANLFLGKT